jgi:hypothetical protein
MRVLFSLLIQSQSESRGERHFIRICFPFFLSTLALCLWTSCARNEDEEATFTNNQRRHTDSLVLNQRLRDSATARALRKANADVPLVSYTRLALDTRSQVDSIKRVFGKKPSTMLGYRVFTTINRKDIQYFRLGDTAIIPSAFHEDLRVYSIFPPLYPAADTLAKLIVISNTYQGYACYERGKLVRFAACNTGREKKPTFPGRYTLNWRDRIRRSSLDSNWILPFTWNFHLFAGSAFHQFDMPGRPVSHSCVRQFMDDAEWLYNWGKGGQIDTATKKYIPMTGTPVIILDVFNYSRPKGGPWWDLRSNKDTLLSLPRVPMAVEEALIPISQIPPEVRWQLPQKERYVFAEDSLRTRGWIREDVELAESINYNKLRRDKAKALRLEQLRKAKQLAKPKQQNT